MFIVLVPARGEDDYGYLDESDPLVIDVEDSLDFGDSEARRFSFDGDLRGGFFSSRQDLRDGGTSRQEDFLARFRFGTNYGISDMARLKVRLAVTCSDSDCDPNLDLLSSTTAGPASTNRGDIVLDELYLDIFRREKLDFAIGRMQTRAATRGGVFISSLSRMTSPNVTINWTDGAALRYRPNNGWASTVILQYNDENGSSMLARAPLDFANSASRVSAFYSLENRKTWGPVTQRAVDVTWLPSALQTGLVNDQEHADYWAIVGRLAAQWQLRESSASFIVSGEVGYAPQTQDSATGSGAADGRAWHVEASWMDFRPGHSVGVNYGYAEEGWLLSPSYRPNDTSFALRYHWRPADRVQVELQGRWREEIEINGDAPRKREDFDWRLRVTWRLRASS